MLVRDVFDGECWLAQVPSVQPNPDSESWIEIGRMVIKDRSTGELVNEGVPIYREDWPFDPPDPSPAALALLGLVEV